MTSIAAHRREKTGQLWLAVAGVLAEAAGHVTRLADNAVRWVPGIGAACLVSWGAAQVYTPAGWIAGGLFLLAMDRQITLRRNR